MAFCRLVWVHSTYSLQWLEAINNGSMTLTLNYNIFFLRIASEMVFSLIVTMQLLVSLKCGHWMSSGLSAEGAAAHCPPSVLTLSNRGGANISTSVIRVSSFQRLWKDNLMPFAECNSRLDTGPYWRHKAFAVEGPYAGTAHQDQHIRWTQGVQKVCPCLSLIKTRFKMNFIWMPWHTYITIIP